MKFHFLAVYGIVQTHHGILTDGGRFSTVDLHSKVAYYVKR